jgi:hypothetical protein
MDTNLQVAESPKTLNVLLIGNNPIDMSRILEKLNQITKQQVITEIAFDLRSILDRLINFDPNYILIDDNLGRSELSQTMSTLAKQSKTKNIPIAVLKNSNYQEACPTNTILDYILKTNISADSLYTTLRNSIKFRKTQLYLYKEYQRRKRSLTAE